MGGTDSQSRGDWEASFGKNSAEAAVGPLGEDTEGEQGAPGEPQAPEQRRKGYFGDYRVGRVGRRMEWKIGDLAEYNSRGALSFLSTSMLTPCSKPT